MRTIFATTRPGWFDSRAIAKQKWLQQLQDPSSTSAGLLASPSTTNLGFHDTKIKTIQKILLKLQA